MKILIIAATLVNYGDDQGGVHEETGAVVDAPKDVAHKLVQAGRALYISKADDPAKDGRNTATKEEIKAAEALAKAAAEAAAAAAAASDPAK